MILYYNDHILLKPIHKVGAKSRPRDIKSLCFNTNQIHSLNK